MKHLSVLPFNRTIIFLLVCFGLLGISQITSAQTTYTSNCTPAGNGICNWNSGNNWTPNVPNGPGSGDNVIILEGHQINTQNSRTVNNITVQSGGVLVSSAALTINGNLIVDGNLVSTSAITLSGASKILDGDGAISTSSTFTFSTDRVIAASANLSIVNSGNVRISNGVTIDNQGKISVSGNITATTNTGTGTPIWLNSSGSQLSIGGNFFANTSNGTLHASSIGNTIVYDDSGNQTIFNPSSSTYYNLVLAGSGNKFMTTNYTVLGNLEITSSLKSAASPATNPLALSLAGNWNNSGVFYSTGITDSIINVSLTGGANQTILNSINPSGEGFHNLNINKTGGDVTLQSDITISNQLSTQITNTANIVTSGKIVTLGTSTTSPGSLTWQTGDIIGKFRRWIISSETITPVFFPLGGAAGSAPLYIKFNALNGGTLTSEFSSKYPGRSGLESGLSDGGATIYNSFNEGVWILTSGNSLSSSDFNLELTAAWFDSFDFNSSSRIIYRSADTAPWSMNGIHDNSGNFASGNLKRLNLSSLNGEYGFGSDNVCVPPVTSDIVAQNLIVCQGNTVTYTVDETLGNTYEWSLTNGNEVITGQGTNEISITWSNVGRDVVLTVQEFASGCGFGSPKTIDIRVNTIAPIIIGSQSVPDLGGSHTYSISNVVAGYQYDWIVTGASLVSGTQGTSIDIVWPALEGAGTIQVTASDAVNCPANPSSSSMNVNIYKVIKSTGNNTSWSNKQAWDCSCDISANSNVAILPGHTINMGAGINPQIKNLFVLGNLNINTNIVTITEDLEVDGTLAGAGGSITLSTNANKELRGSGGNISVTTFNISSPRTIPANSLLTRTGSFLIQGVTVTNKGITTVTTLGGSNTVGTKWINDVNSNLIIGGALLSGSNQQLDASAAGNTVSYVQGSSTNVKTGQYYNLEISGTNSKQLSTVAALNSISISNSFINSGVFVPNQGSVTFNGNSASISGSANTNFYNLTIANSSTLTSSPLTINVLGSFVNNGTFIANAGTVGFTGTAASVLSGTSPLTTFNNLTITNTAGVTSELNINLASLLSIGAGSTFDPDGISGTSVFTLLSTNDETATDASIGPLLSGANVNGKITAQRYMSGEGRIYRYLSSPISNATVDSWKDDFAITGNFSGATPAGAIVCGLRLTSNPSMFWYNETAAGGLSNGYVDFPKSSAGESSTTLLKPGRGYAAFVRNCNPITIDVTGIINSGAINLDVTYTDNVVGDDLIPVDGWNLVGNPYPSAISWDNSGWTGTTPGLFSGTELTGISGTIAVPDNGTNGGMMRYYDGVAGSTDDFNGIIASGQAFWVRTLTENPTLIINELAKISDATHTFYRKRQDDISSLVISLSNNQITDKAVIRLRNHVSSGIDKWDAPKLDNELFDLATYSSDNIPMAINALPELYEGIVIPIMTRDMEDGQYQIELKADGAFSSYHAEIIDEEEKTSNKLNWGDRYSFTTKQGNTTKNDNRFKIRLTKGLTEGKEVRSQLSVFPVPVIDKMTIDLEGEVNPEKITIFDALGVKADVLEIGNTNRFLEVDFTIKPAGFYLVRLDCKGYYKLTRVIKN